MKKVLALLLSALLLSALLLCALSACGGKDEPAVVVEAPAAAQPAKPAAPEPAKQEPDKAEPAKPEPAAPAGWASSKTGKFYAQFANGMYMEYEMEVEGTPMTIATATKGDKTYAETKMGGQTVSVSVIDQEAMYLIDHASKMVIKMSSQPGGEEMVNTMIEEADIDPASFKAGKREIEGKTYDTEEWSIEGATSLLCFDGDRLAYIIGSAEGQDMIIKVLKTDTKVDSSLFEIPADYQVMSY